MTEAVKCDGPDCGRFEEWLPEGWLLLETLDEDEGQPHHFCSIGCLGSWVMEQSGTLDQLRAD